MARIRTIKPSLWGDDKVAQLSRDARLLFIGIISNADDEGRFIATPVALSGTIFPLDDLPPAPIKRWRGEIVGQGLIRLYRVGPHEYGYLPHWRKHQRIDKPQPSALPPPPDDEPFAESIPESFPESLGERPSNDSRGDRKGSITPNPTAAAAGNGCAAHRPHPHPNCRGCRTNPRAQRDAAVQRGPWCGECDEQTRMRGDEDHPEKCPCARPVGLRVVGGNA